MLQDKPPSGRTNSYAGIFVSERIGVIGLGVMGLPMTLNLLAAGHGVTVASRSPRPVERATAAGATPGSSPRAVAEAADVVITMLPDTPDVELVARGADGLLAGFRERAPCGST